jgi:hypothetical protein
VAVDRSSGDDGRVHYGTMVPVPHFDDRTASEAGFWDGTSRAAVECHISKIAVKINRIENRIRNCDK